MHQSCTEDGRNPKKKTMNTWSGEITNSKTINRDRKKLFSLFVVPSLPQPYCITPMPLLHLYAIPSPSSPPPPLSLRSPEVSSSCNLYTHCSSLGHQIVVHAGNNLVFNFSAHILEGSGIFFSLIEIVQILHRKLLYIYTLTEQTWAFCIAFCDWCETR